MQAIRTKYHGPTASRGSRISASCEAKRISVPYDCALSAEENHAAACKVLTEKLGWVAPYYTQPVPGGFGEATYWVFPPKSSR